MKMAFDPQAVRPQVMDGEAGKSGEKQQAGLKQLCQDFEAIFINSLFQEMRRTIPEEGWLKESPGRDLFQEMMDMEVAGEMARRGGLGLAQGLYRQLQGAVEHGEEQQEDPG
ncbi:MAG: rod-binding protein [Desulfohalobiaceae bacterium]|nr:rod-binding protein [Desulfohalobiaceae bacterium]